MRMKRRAFLKNTLATSSIGIAVAAGLLTPASVMAAWPQAAMKATSIDHALKGTGMAGAQKEKGLKIKAPGMAENGGTVPVTVSSKIPGITAMAIFVKGNDLPLTSAYDITDNIEPYISTQIKMAKSSEIIVVAKAGDKLYQNTKFVKVTVSGYAGK